jgi:hypothetical protein
MTICETLPVSNPPGFIVERRTAPREPVAGTLWMIDHYGSTVLKCQCVETSEGGMRLRVPLGYGIAEGQRYELRSHLPGSRPGDGFGVVGSRWATVIRTQFRLGEDEDHLDVGVVLDSVRDTSLSYYAAAAAIGS